MGVAIRPSGKRGSPIADDVMKLGRKIGCVVTAPEGRIVGILTEGDFVKMYGTRAIYTLAPQPPQRSLRSFA